MSEQPYDSARDLAKMAWFVSRGATGAGQWPGDPDDFAKQTKALGEFEAWWSGGGYGCNLKVQLPYSHRDLRRSANREDDARASGVQRDVHDMISLPAAAGTPDAGSLESPGGTSLAAATAALRPEVEHYVRCSFTRGEFVVEPGLELRPGDDFDSLTGQLGRCAEWVASQVARGRDRAGAAQWLCAEMEDRWPGRAWFCEIHDAKLERWTQSFQPYGLPRSR